VEHSQQQLYTLSRWSVKSGNEEAFIHAWQEFSEWTLRHRPGAEGEARLLQDHEHPGLFFAIRLWEDTQSIEGWRKSPEFREFITKAVTLCEDVHPHLLTTVACARKSSV
jgi:quinol monooxygenase YgiN